MVKEVENEKTRIMEQEWVITDKGPWGPQLIGERMDELLQERLNTCDNTIKGEVAQVQQSLQDEDTESHKLKPKISCQCALAFPFCSWR